MGGVQITIVVWLSSAVLSPLIAESEPIRFANGTKPPISGQSVLEKDDSSHPFVPFARTKPKQISHGFMEPGLPHEDAGEHSKIG